MLPAIVALNQGSPAISSFGSTKSHKGAAPTPSDADTLRQVHQVRSRQQSWAALGHAPLTQRN
jgi:hypothetical protein